ncbi:SDR family oxidoreductase [Streptomyces sp. NBC_01353]|uniref:SDR family oxidoreductase n=1 Tax=Streptomyces sp. NBC_01353 TaxID=2903835 RepID=UPI002E37CAA0|nr:SDR family oxidoreductase [Streptomyces sp. NBC_01353]
MHLTKELAVELSPRIRVNAVAQAVVRTRFAAALNEGEDSVAAECPPARLGAPDDIAGGVAFLLSADAAWMTGRAIVVDGGLAAAGGA